MIISDIVSRGKFCIVTTENCPGCRQQKKILDKAGFDYEVVDLFEVADEANLLGIMHAPTICWYDKEVGVATLKGPVTAKTLESLVQ